MFTKKYFKGLALWYVIYMSFNFLVDSVVSWEWWHFHPIIDTITFFIIWVSLDYISYRRKLKTRIKLQAIVDEANKKDGIYVSISE